jgi:hypothetical protein
MKICWGNPNLYIGQKYWTLYMKTFFFHIFGKGICSATITRTHCCGSKKTLSIFILLTMTIFFSEKLLIQRRIQGDAIINVQRSSCKVPVVLVRFSWNVNFLDRFSQNTHISNFANIRPVGVELFHADGRTEITKLIVALRNVMKTRKMPVERLMICDKPFRRVEL